MSDNKLKRFVSGEITPKSSNLSPASSPSPASPSPSAEGRGDAGIDISELLDIVRRGKWIIMATAVVVTCAIAGYTYTLDPIFEARSIVRIDLGGQPGAGAIAFSQERDLSSEVGVLEHSAELASRVVEELRATEEALDENGKFPLLYDENGSSHSTNEVMEKMAEAVSFTPMPSQNMITILV